MEAVYYVRNEKKYSVSTYFSRKYLEPSAAKGAFYITMLVKRTFVRSAKEEIHSRKFLASDRYFKTNWQNVTR
jgi:hypothetical protein